MAVGPVNYECAVSRMDSVTDADSVKHAPLRRGPYALRQGFKLFRQQARREQRGGGF